MWVIKYLNGPQAGQTKELKPGRNVFGRAPTCDIQVPSLGASKEHCEITWVGDRILIRDLQSRNGTLVNGVRIQNGMLRSGDKVGVHDIIFEVYEPRTQNSMPVQAYTGGAAAPQIYQQHQMQMPPPMPNSMPASGPQPQASAQNFMVSQGFVKGLISNIQEYLERVALPGVYKLPEVAEFKWVICGFLASLIFAVTLLSMVPAMQVSKASILNESKRRAQSLARSLALLNQGALMGGSFASVSTYSIESEDGVKQAFIIQQVDGLIVAPATLQGRVSEYSFVHRARTESKSQVETIDGSTIGASFPIGVYDPNTGEPNVKYHAIIIYDVSSMALDDSRAIAMFLQTLLLACLAGIVLFYFMYKMIEYPIANLNVQLDTAMREKKDNLGSKYQFPALQNLIGNINSLLTRQLHGDSSGQQVAVSYVDEAAKMPNLTLNPCLVMKASGEIIAANSAFSDISRVSVNQLVGQFASSIPDNSLQQNIEFLLSKSRENPFMLHSDQLEFGGVMYQLNCQAFGQPIDYFIITIFPAGGH
jgi:hypothetical protein